MYKGLIHSSNATWVFLRLYSTHAANTAPATAAPLSPNGAAPALAGVADDAAGAVPGEVCEDPAGADEGLAGASQCLRGRKRDPYY